MAKTKLTVATEFGTFTRTTARTYTHIILVTGNISYATRSLKWKTDEFERSGSVMDEYFTRSFAYANEEVAKAEKNAAEGKYSDLCWCGSPTLAQKAANKARKDGFDNVKIIDITTGKEV